MSKVHIRPIKSEIWRASEHDLKKKSCRFHVHPRMKTTGLITETFLKNAQHHCLTLCSGHYEVLPLDIWKENNTTINQLPFWKLFMSQLCLKLLYIRDKKLKQYIFMVCFKMGKQNKKFGRLQRCKGLHKWEVSQIILICFQALC